MARNSTAVLASAVVDWSSSIIEAVGLFGVAALVALETVFPPLPSEAVLLLTGFHVGQGTFGPVGALFWSVLGSLVGALALYGLGRAIGEERSVRLLVTVGRPLGFRRADIERADAWFERHGPWVVFFGRLVPVVRSLVSLPAGTNRMPAGRFALCTVAGSLAWNTLWIGAGHALGDQWHRAEAWSDLLDGLFLAAVAGAGVWVLVRRRRLAAEE